MPAGQYARVDRSPGGLRIAVKNGTTGQLYARDHLPQARVLLFDDEAAALLEVAQGKADAFLYDQMSIYQFAKRNPGTTRGLLAPFQHESWAIGIRKGNTALETQVNAFLADFKAHKGFDALGDKYLKADKAAGGIAQTRAA